MVKFLCKYRRAEIAAQFAKISLLVSEPRYVCSSCARSASDKAYLCKPCALSVKGKEATSRQPLHPTAPDGSEGDGAMPPLPVKKKQAKQLEKAGQEEK